MTARRVFWLLPGLWLLGCSAGGTDGTSEGPDAQAPGGSGGQAGSGGKGGQAGKSGSSGQSGAGATAGAGGSGGAGAGAGGASGASGQAGSGTGGAQAGGTASGGAGAGQAGAGEGGSGGAGGGQGGAGGSGQAGSGAGGVGGAGAGGSGGSGQAGSGAGGVGGSGGSGPGGAGESGAGQGGAGGSGGSGQAGSDSCVPVSPQPDVDPWSVAVPSAGFGGIVTEQKGGFTDVFLQSPAVGGQPANYTRIGARLEWGGTIVFFGLGANANSNVIDANDTGREVQLAVYDPTRIRQPCAADASCLTSQASCGNSITYLGWNPVQGGDECGHGAPVVSHGQQGEALRLVVQPLQWNPDWDRTDCASSACGAQGRPVEVLYTFELRYLSAHLVEVMSEVQSNESISHPETGQEFPTMYVAHGQKGPDLPLLLDAAGAQPSIDTVANDGFFYGNFASPEPWVTWQNSTKDYGVGLGHDQGVKQFQGWRGDGSSAPYFHNVRAQLAFGLPAGGVVRGRSYLALGGFGTVQSELQGVLKKRAPFGHVDSPTQEQAIQAGGGVAVTGWVLDNQHVASVRVDLDGVPAATLPVDQGRADVCAVYPAYDGCPAVGFAGTVSTGGLADGCAHLMQVVAQDVDGNVTILGERRLLP